MNIMNAELSTKFRADRVAQNNREAIERAKAKDLENQNRRLSQQ